MSQETKQVQVTFPSGNEVEHNYPAVNLYKG